MEAMTHLLDEITGEVPGVEGRRDQHFGLRDRHAVRFALNKRIETLTSTMCCWNTLPGPSLSSETCTTTVGTPRDRYRSTYNELVALGLEPVANAKLRLL